MGLFFHPQPVQTFPFQACLGFTVVIQKGIEFFHCIVQERISRTLVRF
jgi:hypothetical protein